MAEVQLQDRLTVPNKPRAVVLVPNRELAMQVHKEAILPFKYQVPLKSTLMYSGQASKREYEALDQGVDILVSTIDKYEFRKAGKKLG